MTSATERLRALLDERGVEWRPIAWNPKKETFYHTSDGVGFCADEYVDGVKIYTDAIIAPEQAVAATLGSERHAYKQRITCDGSDWGEIMSDAFDSLMSSASESCTPDEMRALESHITATLGGRMLTADDVRDAIERYSDASGGNGRDLHSWAYTAIADELNATLGRGTCREVKIDHYWRGCGECGYVWEFMYGIGKCERPRYCPSCGRRIVGG